MEAESGIEPLSTALQAVSYLYFSIGYESYHPPYHPAWFHDVWQCGDDAATSLYPTFMYAPHLD